MAKEMGLGRAPIEFQTFYFSHVLVVPPNVWCLSSHFSSNENFDFANSEKKLDKMGMGSTPLPGWESQPGLWNKSDLLPFFSAW